MSWVITKDGLFFCGHSFVNGKPIFNGYLMPVRFGSRESAARMAYELKSNWYVFGIKIKEVTY